MNKLSIRDFSLFIALLAIWLVFGMLNDQFFSPRNISNLSIELALTTTAALGMLLVLLPGHIDLSVGSGAAFIGGIASVLVSQHYWPAPIALLIGVAAALVIWFLMGTFIVKQFMPSFIVTLGGLLIFRGLHHIITGSKTVPVAHGTDNFYSMLTTYYIPPQIGWIIFAGISAALIWSTFNTRKRRTQFGFKVDDLEITILKLIICIQALALTVIVLNNFRGIPLSLAILALLAFALYILTQHTTFGRYLYAIGGNTEAARLSGIPVNKIVIIAFTILGAVVALTGFIQAAYTGSSTPIACEYLELDAIAACVIGGTSLKGGRGTVLGVLFGSLIMASLLNGLTLMACKPAYILLARGGVLILAVWIDISLARRSGIAVSD